MAESAEFDAHSLEELEAAIAEQNVEIPLAHDIAILCEPAQFGEHTVPNRMSILLLTGDGTSSLKHFMCRRSSIWISTTIGAFASRAIP